MSDKFNPEAYDGDKDGFVQDGTPWERPVEDVLVDPTVEEVEEEAPAPVVEDVISAPEPVEDTTPALAPVEGGAIGSSTTKKKAAPKKKKEVEEPKPEKVAVFSTRNVTWSGVGKVYRGYNIVTKEQSEKWLNRDHIRLATPEEVAKEFGN